MPSRLIRRQTSFAIQAMFMAMMAATPLFAQELQLPGELSSSGVGPASQPATSVPSGGPMALSPNLGNSYGMDAVPMHAGPTSAFAAGSVYNPTLGSHLRARYNTQSYGQQKGTLDLGTMKMMDWDGGVLFMDGQVTMNDESHIGYNLGVGYRWMTLPMFPFSPDDEKIMGVSLWSDGQTVGGDNFFSQVGVSLEMLGEHIDFRANGYAPVGSRTRTRDGIETGTIVFSENSLAQQLELIRDTALTVGEAEVAGRLGDLDAWAFTGIYGLSGGQYSAVGGKVGLRGYATPDLLLSIAIANDDEFDTNALFSATWFIGRTRAENCPTGTLRDRMREPVFRNDYIATQQDSVLVAGDAINDVGNNPIRIVHVDSTAAAGGDGTFENPLASLNDINGNSLDDDIVLAHGGSDFNDQTAALRVGQTFVGEGGGNTFSVALNGLGTIALPETADGARDGALPTIAGAAGQAGVVLADNNTVQNLQFDGGLNAITNGVTGSNNMNLNNLTIGGTTGDGISLTAVARTDTTDIDGDGEMDDQVNAMGTVLINDIDFDGVGGNDIDINADTGALADADIVNESISIDDITSVNNTTAQSIAIRNTSTRTVTGTTTTGTASITDFDYNGAAAGAGAGAILIDQTAGNVVINRVEVDNTTGAAITLDQSSGSVDIDNLTYNGGTTGTGAVVIDRTSGNVTLDAADLNNGVGPTLLVTQTTGTVSVGNTVDINDVSGEAIFVDRVAGTDPAGVAINANVINDSTVDGGGVRVFQNESVVSFDGNITTLNDESITVTDNRANVTFSGPIDDNGTGDAITITNNGTSTTDSAEVSIAGAVTNEMGRSIVINGGDSNILISGALTDNGDGVDVQGRQSGSEVTLGAANVSTIINTMATNNNAITLSGNASDSIFTVLSELDIDSGGGIGIAANGGQIDINDAGNTITTTTGRAIDITNSSTVTGIRVANVVTDGSDRAISVDGLSGAGSLTIDAGTVTTTNTAVFLEDVTNASISDLTISGATGTAVDINSTNSTASDITLTNVTTPSSATTALDATQTGTGDLSVTVNDSNFSNTTGNAVVFTDIEGTVDVNNTDINNAGGRGVLISGGTGTFNFDTATPITNAVASSFVVDGGSASITYNGDILSSSGRSVLIENMTGGDVSFGATASVTDTGDGVLIRNNTGGTFSFLGPLDINNNTIDGAGTLDNAITLQNNSAGTSTSFADLTLQTTSGNAFEASGGGSLTVSGSTNTITTTGGRGIDIEGMNLVSQVNFDEVTVNGADTAINLVNNTGVGVTIGDSTSSTDGDGGTLTTTGTAIVVNNSGGLIANNVDIVSSGANSIDIDSTNGTNMNVTLNNVDTPGTVNLDHTGSGNVTFAFNNSTVEGTITTNHSGSGTFDFNSSNLDVNSNIDVNATGGGAFDFFATNLDIDTGGAATEALGITMSGDVASADISLTGTTNLTTGDAEALAISSAGSARTVNFELSGGTLTNTSATDDAFVLNSNGITTVNATISGNTFNSAGGNTDFLMSTGANARANLILADNIVGGANALVLTNGGAPTTTRFNIQAADATAVQESNGNDTGRVEFTGGDVNFEFNDALIVPAPTN